jgi:hypothetical protein
VADSWVKPPLVVLERRPLGSIEPRLLKDGPSVSIGRI